MTSLSAFGSNRGIPHTSGSWEYGRGYLLFSLSVGFVIWRKIASLTLTTGSSDCNSFRSHTPGRLRAMSSRLLSLNNAGEKPMGRSVKEQVKSGLRLGGSLAVFFLAMAG